MRLLNDDPIVHSLERWGLPPWLMSGGAFDEDDEQEEYDDGNIY